MASGEDGVAALPVWAKAEIVKVTATARRTRTSLLFIGSVELLRNIVRNLVPKKIFIEIALRSLLQSTLGRSAKSPLP
jgi:hypothetical protein